MSSTDLKAQRAFSYLSGASMSYIDALYEDYLADPNSVPADWQDAFKAMKSGVNTTEVAHRDIRAHFLANADKPRQVEVSTEDSKQYRVADLMNAYRALGHLNANLDPLGMMVPMPIPSLALSYHQLSEADLSRKFYAGKYFSQSPMALKEIIQALKDTYCGSIGIEYMYISDNAETQWLQEKMETTRGRPHFNDKQKKALLSDLIAADGLERYLGTRFVGQKRFSLEGGDALIPMMKEMVRQGGLNGVQEMVIGMAHRGRLNVLINVLGKEPGILFQEFEGKIKLERTGDVKYHMGFSSNVRTEDGAIVHLALAFNPSHLEIIGPVVEGSARTRLERRRDLLKKDKVVPIVIHGDAAMAGQGVVMETFNFSQVRGYCTGGTVHIVINNQIGFTTSDPIGCNPNQPIDSRSTVYCTDVAKMVQAPILHVNGDDPEAVLFATQIAFEFRMKFKRDVVIDLVCYRRNGHNEADEPSVTQPTMYKKIKSMAPLREIYGKHLVDAGIVNADAVKEEMETYRTTLDQGQSVVNLVQGDYPERMATDWTPFINAKWTDEVNTTISAKTIADLSARLHKLPEGFEVHPVVAKLLADREKMTLDEIPMNWGYAETMAYASLLNEGYGVRLSGQDSGRGTFAHRHAVLHDHNTGARYVPLSQTVSDEHKPFEVIDSVLSEEAILAFEYGYACSAPNSLVLWEAQFGDFANGAQVVIDQFISSGEQKWGRLCGLVMLLPHGYEGQGPEHSSARLERYMQLCAEQNIQVCTPTTPAQIFHLLRRQVLRKFRKPLIIMTPKSLLRHKLAVSPLSDLQKGKFHTVIPEIDALDAAKVKKVILCCGKVYYDLLEKRRASNVADVAIIRIEQLYPFPAEALKAELKKFPNAKNVAWCQEEPQNQGVWFASQHHIKDCLEDQSLTYVGRGFAASPAAGSVMMHTEQQQALVAQALEN